MVRPKLIIVLYCGLLACFASFGQKKPQSGFRIACPIVGPKLTKIVKPTYPELAKQAHIEGKVSLKCFIGLDGSVEKIEVEKGHELLVPAATEAVSQWKYEPLVLGGKAVDRLTTVDIIFQLPKEQKKSDSHKPSD